ncbi:MAG: energy-coupling factor ABC transporter ATP-binding protein [Thermodesulfobacteriota bacterium]
MVYDPPQSPVISLRGIHFSYPGRQAVFSNLDFDFYPGDRVGLLAPNGSGKTTLFHLIMGLLAPDAGRIEIFSKPVVTEKDFVGVRRRIGLLFQDADDQLFSPTVIEDVAFGPLNMGKSKQDAIDISRRTLSFLGLSDFEDRITFKLSGGEKRLVSLATVLAMNPEVLLLDEPMNGLDADTRLKLKEVLDTIDISYMVISHDIDFLIEATGTIYTLTDGRIMKDEKDYVHRHDHAHLFGHVPHQHK